MGMLFKCLVITFAFAALTSDAYAQQASSPAVNEGTARGIKLYQQGDTIGAIEALRSVLKHNKEDADAWHFLGLALVRSGEAKNSRKAFETAIKLRPRMVESHVGLSYALLLNNKLKDAKREAELALGINPEVAHAHYILGVVSLRTRDSPGSLKEADTALRLDGNLAEAHLLRSQALIGVFLKEAARGVKTTKTDRWLRLRNATESLERYLKLSRGAPDNEVWRNQLEVLRSMVGSSDQSGDDRKIFLPSEVTTKPRILSRLEPVYTDEAKKRGIVGTVILLAELTFDGRVTNVLVLQGLPSGLTQVVISAVRKVTFEPAIKDGKPVSTVLQFEYNFSLY